jgi:ubiquinone/menaquinone biosynthesis C-methylase UbiE
VYGSEPTNRELVALGLALVIQAPAEEELPLADQTVDAAMAILTVHHWESVRTGLRELVRVVRDRVVLMTTDVQALGDLSIVRDYLPELLGQHASRFPRRPVLP